MILNREQGGIQNLRTVPGSEGRYDSYVARQGDLTKQRNTIWHFLDTEMCFHYSCVVGTAGWWGGRKQIQFKNENLLHHSVFIILIIRFKSKFSFQALNFYFFKKSLSVGILMILFCAYCYTLLWAFALQTTAILKEEIMPAADQHNPQGLWQR